MNLKENFSKILQKAEIIIVNSYQKLSHKPLSLKQQRQSPKKKLFLILTILILIIVIIGLIVFLVSTIVKTTDLNNSKNLKVILSNITTEAAKWQNDFAIEACESTEFTTEYEIASFSCNIYSPGLNQTRLALWKESKVSLSNPITLNPKYKEAFKGRKSIINIEKIDFQLRKFILTFEDYNFTEIDKLKLNIDNTAELKFSRDNIAQLTINPSTESKKVFNIDLETSKLIN